MDIEVIPQVAALILSTLCAISDAIKGKVYNRFIAVGLVFAFAFLGFYIVWTELGMESAVTRYPELGHFLDETERDVLAKSMALEQARRDVAQMNAAQNEPMPWERTEGVSVYPPPNTMHRGSEPETSIYIEPLTLEEEEVLASIGPPSAFIYLAKVFLNVAIATLAAFGMWWFGMWAAGDAKLFIALTALIPLSTYVNAYWPYFPSYVLLFNTFFCIMAVLVIELAVRLVRQAVRPRPDEAQAWRDALDWLRNHKWDAVRGFFAILFFFLVIKTLRMLTREYIFASWDITDSVLVYFLLFLLFQPFANLMRRRYIGWPVMGLTLAWITWVSIFPTEEYNFIRVIYVGTRVLALMFFWIVYQLYLNIFDYRLIKVWELKPKMILSPRTLDVLKEDEDLLRHKMGPIGPDGLTAEQTETLRRWWIDRGKGPTLWVARTFPFTPALALGTFLTVFFGGYFVRF